jgi:deoxycytidylate deaminase
LGVPGSQVGCTIVNPDGVVVSMGYNGFPMGCSDDKVSPAGRKVLRRQGFCLAEPRH